MRGEVVEWYKTVNGGSNLIKGKFSAGKDVAGCSGDQVPIS